MGGEAGSGGETSSSDSSSSVSSSSSNGQGGSGGSSSATGGNGGASSSSSVSSSSGCNALTCAEAGKNCGQLDTGCGQVIECGTCDQELESCGGAMPQEADGTPGQGTPGVCGGGCVRRKDGPDWWKCSKLGLPPETDNVYQCDQTVDGTQDFLQGCVPYMNNAPTDFWCC